MISSAVGCRWILILLAAVLPVSAAYFPPPDAEGGWRCATNGQSVIRRRAGLDARRLAQAWEYNQRCSQNAGLLVVRHGWLAWERYVGRANREARPDMASTGKAYTSIACGMLLQEFPDRFPQGLETRVFTPEFLPEAFSAEGRLDDPRRADITLGHLLCMSGGYTGEGGAPTAVVMGRSFPLKSVPGQDLRDLDGSSLRCAMWTNAGGGYSYSSPEPHIASMVLRRVSGMDLREYLDVRLAKPMGWGGPGTTASTGVTSRCPMPMARAVSLWLPPMPCVLAIACCRTDVGDAGNWCPPTTLLNAAKCPGSIRTARTA